VQIRFLNATKRVVEAKEQLDSKAYPPASRGWYAVAVLTVAYILSFIDRQILSLLVVPIRRDLHISDTQMSLLMGISFALFYTLFGLPIGRLADSRSRRNIITSGVIAWSLFTAGCGLASSYVRLFLMRVGVGVGEAALSPPAYSLLSDYFAPQQRALALSVYGLGIFLGIGMAMIFGGIIVPHTSSSGIVTLPLLGLSVFPWQLNFFIVGLPGVLVAALVRTVREPERRERKAVVAPSISVIIVYIKEYRATFACLHLATSMMALAGYASMAWIPTFFIRTYGWSAGQAGLVFGSEVAVFSSLGILAGGWTCDFLVRHGYRDAHFRVGLIVCLLILLPAVLYPLMPTSELAVALLIPFAFLNAATYGVAPAALQQVTPNEMRGQVSAIYLFVINLMGLGVGPTAVALVTDRVFHNDNMLRFSLLLVCTGSYALSGLLWWLGLKPYRRTVERV
jgi:MFS family permease